MTAASVRDYGVRLIWIAGILGAAVSLYNYFSAESGIGGTPGAMLVVVSSAVLFVFGLAIGADRGRRRAWRVVIGAACLFVILGTAFAGYLLNSQALVVLMLVALLGWCLYLVQPRHAASTLAFLLLLPLVHDRRHASAAADLAAFQRRSTGTKIFKPDADHARQRQEPEDCVEGEYRRCIRRHRSQTCARISYGK